MYVYIYIYDSPRNIKILELFALTLPTVQHHIVPMIDGIAISPLLLYMPRTQA